MKVQEMLFSPRPLCEWRESQVLNPGLTFPRDHCSTYDGGAFPSFLCSLPQFPSKCSSCVCISNQDCYTHRPTWKLNFKTRSPPKLSVLGQANPSGILPATVSTDLGRNCIPYGFFAQCSSWGGIIRRKILKP